MINRREINIESLIEVAEALGDLNNRAVYVGGAVVSMYLNDPAAEDPRPTKDIDVAMEIATVGELEKVRNYLKLELEHLLKLEEAVLGHLNPFTQKERFEILKKKTEAIIKSKP
ncbi:MAG: hypothetical protein K9H13_12790 [Bacteroidales bacterium]|nr:hypothetical protein [Bacteroidales bacterium]